MTTAQRFKREIDNAMLHLKLGNPRGVQALVRSQPTARKRDQYVGEFLFLGVPEAVIFGND